MLTSIKWIVFYKEGLPMMRIFIIFLLALCFSTNSTARLQRYISLNDDYVLINPSRTAFLLENNVGELASCVGRNVSQCWMLGNIVLAIPDSIGELHGPTELYVEQRITINVERRKQTYDFKGESVEGFNVKVIDHSNAEKPIDIFFSEERGILFFSYAGEFYMSTQRCGLFSSMQCNLKPWFRKLLAIIGVSWTAVEAEQERNIPRVLTQQEMNRQ